MGKNGIGSPWGTLFTSFPRGSHLCFDDDASHPCHILHAFISLVQYYKATDRPSMIMTARQELSSWLTPSKVDTRPVPDVNSKAPSLPQIQFPRGDGKPVIVTFLRHCGCPCKTISYPKSGVILMLCSRRENLLVFETDSFR